MSHFWKQLAGAFVLVLAFTHTVLAQTTTLRMANWLPPVHHMTQTLGNWAAEVEKASEGSLKIDLLKAPLGKPPAQYDLVKNGVVDIAWGVPAYTPGRFHMMRVMELPFLSPNAEMGSAGLWEWYSKHNLLEKEFADTKLLAVFVHGPGVLHSKEAILSLEELEGVKLRVGGGGVAMSDQLGAVPVAMPANQAHESLQRGTTEGAFFPWESIKGFRLGKLVGHHLEFPGGLYTTPFFLVMNQKSWENLSAEHKEVLNKVGGAWGSRFIGKGWDAADTVGKKQAMANGNKISTIAAKEFDRWKEKTQFMAEEWIKKADAAGHDGKALYEDLQAIMKKQ